VRRKKLSSFSGQLACNVFSHRQQCSADSVLIMRECDSSMLRLRSKAALLAGSAIVVSALAMPQAAHADPPSVPLSVCNDSDQKQLFSLQGTNSQQHVVTFPADRNKREPLAKRKCTDIPGMWKIGSDLYVLHRPNGAPAEVQSHFIIPANAAPGVRQIAHITATGPTASTSSPVPTTPN
jgi:hypothetical protein